MSRINKIITIARARDRRVTHETIAELVRDKERLLNRGQIILMANDFEARERWLAEYSALSRRINDAQIELEAA